MRLRRSWRSNRSRPTLLAVSAILLATVEADTTDDSTTAAATTSDDATTTSDSSTASSTDSTSDSTTATSTDSSTATDTSSTTASDTTSTSNTYPTISSSSTTSTSSSSSTYAIPIVTVPPTAGAPYMQKSNLPEGTVFICVGAALALVGLVMIIWRLAVTWWINRSVRRAALSNFKYPNDTKTAPASGHNSRSKSGIYAQAVAHDSSHSLDKFGKEGRHNSSMAMANPDSSLFFSPTAGTRMLPMTNNGRDRSNTTNYSPGFYSSPNHSTSGQINGMSMTQLGQHSPLSGRKYYNAQSSANSSPLAYSGAYGENESPDLPPISTPTKMPGARAPSQYLDDLMSIPSLPPPQGQQGSPERKGRQGRRRSGPRK